MTAIYSTNGSILVTSGSETEGNATFRHINRISSGFWIEITGQVSHTDNEFDDTVHWAMSRYLVMHEALHAADISVQNCAAEGEVWFQDDDRDRQHVG